MADFEVADKVDVTDVVCPVTFVKTKIALDGLDEGEVLQVHLAEGEPLQNVPRSCKEEGHKVLKLDNNGDGTFEMYVEKGPEE